MPADRALDGRVARLCDALSCVLLAGGLLLGPPASAQPLVHPGVPTLDERPLHARVASADAVVVGRIESVGTGRIQVRVVEPILGRTSDTFELKRAPSHPPPLRAGDSALLLLRGDRSPYLLVDEPDEVVGVDGDADLVRWRRAVAAIGGVSGSPTQIARIYAGWLDDESPDLRRAAVVGLGDPASTLPSPGAAADLRLAELAVDSELLPLVRLRAAGAALRTPVGRGALISRLPGGDGADAQVLAVGVQAALRNGGDAGGALLRSLDHESATIRRAAVRLCALMPQEGELRARLVEMTAGDPDEGVRLAARRALGG